MMSSIEYAVPRFPLKIMMQTIISVYLCLITLSPAVHKESMGSKMANIIGLCVVCAFCVFFFVSVALAVKQIHKYKCVCKLIDTSTYVIGEIVRTEELTRGRSRVVCRVSGVSEGEQEFVSEIYKGNPFESCTTVKLFTDMKNENAYYFVCPEVFDYEI